MRWNLWKLINLGYVNQQNFNFKFNWRPNSKIIVSGGFIKWNISMK